MTGVGNDLCVVPHGLHEFYAGGKLPPLRNANIICTNYMDSAFP